MSIKISLILSVFNSSFWIDKAIQNLLEQDFEEFEILIVNDGSVDDTEKRILKYTHLNPKINYFFKKHTGLTDSLNFALGKANGEWIARIDVDDFSVKDRLSKQLDYAERKDNLILIGSNFTLRKKDSIIYRSNLPDNDKKLLYRLRNMKGFFPHSSAFFKKDEALSIGGYRKAFKKSQDHDLWLRLSEIGGIGCHQESLVEINEHEKRISNSKTGWNQHVYVLTAISDYYLRKKGIKFLEKKINNCDMDDVLEKANKYLEKNNFYRIQNLKRNIKNIFLEKNKLFLVKNLILFILKNKLLFFKFLKIKFFRSNLAFKFHKYL